MQKGENTSGPEAIVDQLEQSRVHDTVVDLSLAVPPPPPIVEYDRVDPFLLEQDSFLNTRVEESGLREMPIPIISSDGANPVNTQVSLDNVTDVGAMQAE